MAITISGANNVDKILATDGVLDSISGFNVVGVMTATTFNVTTKHTANHIDVGSSIQLGNAGIITATTLIGNVTGNVNSTSHLLLQISGSEKFRVGNGGQLGIGGANYGTSGQVLTSGGSGSAATWTTPLNLNNATDNRVITSAGGATLNGESTLTYAEPTLEIATTNSSYGALKLDGNSGGLIEFKDNGTRKWELYGASNFSFYDRANTKYGLILKPAGDVEIPDGNLVIGTAGHGIDFSATADGGTGTPSELLDDYEEGYFAPTIENLTSGYASGTFYNRQCRYTKVGNMVTVWGHIQFWGQGATSGSDGTEFSILGFPFEIDGVGYRGTCGGPVVAQSWKYQGSGWNNYNVDSSNVQCGINGNEQIRFFVFKHDSITGTVTQKSINGYSPNIEWCFTVRVTTYK